MIVVTGTGRSGTAYMSALFQALGLDVGHEHWGKDGISAFQLGTWEHRQNLQWDQHTKDQPLVVYHVVRHPCKVISSWMGRADTLRGMVPATIWKDDPLERCATYWWWWNEQVERSFPDSYQFQIERVLEELPAIAGLAGIELDEDMYDTVKLIDTEYGTSYGGPGGRKKTGSHRYTHRYAWEELREALEPGTYAKVRQLGVRYGYV